MKNSFNNKQWYSNTVAACIAVVLYVALMNLSSITGALRTFYGYFSALVLGGVLAYTMNPLAMLFQRTVFRRVKKETLRWLLSVGLTVISLLLFIGFVLGTLIPQLYNSVATLIGNMKGYLESLQALIEKWGMADKIKLDQFVDADGIGKQITDYLMKNASGVVNTTAAAGKGLVKWGVALILSVYFLASKDAVKRNCKRLLRALVTPKQDKAAPAGEQNTPEAPMPRTEEKAAEGKPTKDPYESVVKFLDRCNRILVQYISYSLLDAAIIGLTNSIFMTCLGMQYIGLVSLTVAVMNLVPTFGPLVGGLIGGFILLLVDPLDALIFILFTMVLQFIDGYVIKPKMFGGLLGVSGLLILAMIIVCGSMFGVVGILLAIPLASILDYVYEEGFLPYLERKRGIEPEKPAKETTPAPKK